MQIGRSIGRVMSCIMAELDLAKHAARMYPVGQARLQQRQAAEAEKLLRKQEQVCKPQRQIAYDRSYPQHRRETQRERETHTESERPTHGVCTIPGGSEATLR